MSLGTRREGAKMAPPGGRALHQETGLGILMATFALHCGCGLGGLGATVCGEGWRGAYPCPGGREAEMRPGRASRPPPAMQVGSKLGAATEFELDGAGRVVGAAHCRAATLQKAFEKGDGRRSGGLTRACPGEARVDRTQLEPTRHHGCPHPRPRHPPTNATNKKK